MRASVRRRFKLYLGRSPLLLACGMTVLCVPTILAICWVGTEYWADQRIEAAIYRQTMLMASQLNTAESDLEMTFGQIKSITTWVSEEGHALQAIEHPRNVGEANSHLQGIASSFGLDLIYVMDAGGISVAASNWNTPASTIGLDYSDREHFQTAIQGLPGHQFAVGRTTRIPGFYFSMPVRKGAEVVGTVGVKVDQPRLQHLIRLSNSIVTDKYGVVILSENPKYMFSIMDGSMIGQMPGKQRQQRYARAGFEGVPLRSAGIDRHPDIMLLDDEPVLIGSRAMVDAGLTIYMVSDFDVLGDVQRQRMALFWASSGAVALVILGLLLAALFFLRARDYRRRLEKANLKLSRLNSELREQATHDFLTGALNRRAFSTVFGAELERSKRYGEDLSLGVLDIDFFKRINDGRGHAVGDVALKFLVETISLRMRRSDVLARVGGEEFALLMPHTTLAEAALVLDRMRQAISVIAVPDQVPPLFITFSAGVVGWQPGLSERQLMSAADEALYVAKDRGRNRVVMGNV